MKAVDMESGKVTRWQTDAHEAPINSILPLSSGLVASGDDDGCVKLWDGRQSDAVAEFTVHTDCVTDFAYQVPASALSALKHTLIKYPISTCCTTVHMSCGMHDSCAMLPVVWIVPLMSMSHTRVCNMICWICSTGTGGLSCGDECGCNNQHHRPQNAQGASLKSPSRVMRPATGTIMPPSYINMTPHTSI